jgi:hypothetical protein
MTPDEIGHMSDPECGFYIHLVPLGRGYMNAHSHGIPETLDGHLDFQIVIELTADVAMNLVWDLFHQVKDGKRFSDGDRGEVFDGLPVLFKQVPEGHPDRGDVLRVLLSSKEGTLPGDDDHDPEFAPLQATLDTENLPWEAPGHGDWCGEKA